MLLAVYECNWGVERPWLVAASRLRHLIRQRLWTKNQNANFKLRSYRTKAPEMTDHQIIQYRISLLQRQRSKMHHPKCT